MKRGEAAKGASPIPTKLSRILENDSAISLLLLLLFLVVYNLNEDFLPGIAAGRRLRGAGLPDCPGLPGALAVLARRALLRPGDVRLEHQQPVALAAWAERILPHGGHTLLPVAIALGVVHRGFRARLRMGR